MSFNKKESDVVRAFYLADKDGDGELDINEYLTMFHEMGVNLSMDDAKTAFAEKDRDGDGKISLEEFLGKRTDIERAWNALDSDRSGFITSKEISIGAKKFKKALPKIITSNNGQFFIEKLHERLHEKLLLSPKEAQHVSDRPITFEDFSAVLREIEKEDPTWLEPDRVDASPRHSSVRKPSLRRSQSGHGVVAPRSDSVSSITSGIEPLPSINRSLSMTTSSAPPKRTTSKKSKSVSSPTVLDGSGDSRTHFSRYFND